MSGVETVIMVDWSARSAPSPARPVKDAIFVAERTAGETRVTYHRTRAAAVAALEAAFDAALAEGRRVLAGFDFPFGYPRGFARAVTGRDDPLALWGWLAEAVADDDRNGNSRWEVAERLNGMFPGVGPFWGCPAGRASGLLPMRGTARHGHGMAERRAVEERLRRAQPVWKLFTTGSVGSQALLGLPRLEGLRRRYGADLAVRPFEGREAPILLAEVYPSMLDAEVRRRQGPGEILDAAQVRVLAEAFAGLAPGRLDAMLREGDPVEGWIAGLGHEAELVAALR
ncbi:molybdopterin guanine dinucleotide synthesis [Roseicyclus persicicus]|uniref:Molybdopterin guanine dinucleotide synthesis n=1 Tax=Roseicyclus persicicus TaxID=2650661 RepID=A0A7X6GVA9_9RHOB|nr:molybdopterin guanine dinucleotide synthesis [Roseibacterium persicicum]NKX43056.1 molybdopterin guanine dinucleotide synthesis [Roseibacterium persicicum]